LDVKCKTTSFFEIKLLKCPFEEKINLKTTPKNDFVLRKKKKKKNSTGIGRDRVREGCALAVKRDELPSGGRGCGSSLRG
jgi:hypothetical protein